MTPEHEDRMLELETKRERGTLTVQEQKEMIELQMIYLSVQKADHYACPVCGSPVLKGTCCGVCDALRPVGQRF
jgi:rubrerythrin